MICYRDMTFCPFYINCAHAAACERALSPDIVLAAAEFDLPIAQYSEEPYCYEVRVDADT